MAMLALIFVAGLGTTYFAGTVGVDECKQIVREERRKEIDARVAARKAEAAARAAAAATTTTPAPAARTGTRSGGATTFGGVFDPGNLRGQAGGADETAPANEPPPEPAKPKRSPGASTFGGVFDPNNLRGQSESDAGSSDEKSD